jgi:hypothetical protein
VCEIVYVCVCDCFCVRLCVCVMCVPLSVISTTVTLCTYSRQKTSDRTKIKTSPLFKDAVTANIM